MILLPMRLMQKHIYSKQEKQALERRLKTRTIRWREWVIVRECGWRALMHRAVTLCILISQWKGHNLMQAIAQVNRVFRNRAEKMAAVGGLCKHYDELRKTTRQCHKLTRQRTKLVIAWLMYSLQNERHLEVITSLLQRQLREKLLMFRLP